MIWLGDELLDLMAKCYINRDARAVRESFDIWMDERDFDTISFEAFVQFVSVETTDRMIKKPLS